jgi:hypothetical protein
MPQYNRLILNDVYAGPFSLKTPFLHNALLISLVVHSTFIVTVKSNLAFTFNGYVRVWEGAPIEKCPLASGEGRTAD